MYWLQQHRSQVGFTLLELLISIGIIFLLMSLALPSYGNYVDRTNNVLAAKDIVMIELMIERFYLDNNGYPTSLADIGYENMTDPWGNTYEYLRFDEDTKRGEMRKDKNLVPVNDDFDLYSKGKNGTTSKPFTSAPGRDDIVRANNGRFVGLASDY